MKLNKYFSFSLFRFDFSGSDSSPKPYRHSPKVPPKSGSDDSGIASSEGIFATASSSSSGAEISSQYSGAEISSRVPIASSQYCGDDVVDFAVMEGNVLDDLATLSVTGIDSDTSNDISNNLVRTHNLIPSECSVLTGSDKSLDNIPERNFNEDDQFHFQSGSSTNSSRVNFSIGDNANFISDPREDSNSFHNLTTVGGVNKTSSINNSASSVDSNTKVDAVDASIVKNLSVESANLSVENAPAGVKQSLLLRLFESKHFDMSMAVSYLYKCKEPGVQQYIGNRFDYLPLFE